MCVDNIQEAIKKNDIKIWNDFTRFLLQEKTRINLGGINLEGAALGGANLKRAKLGGINLEGANLEEADLGGVNLKGANLKKAKLGGINLEGINLEGVNLEGINLEGAILIRANLKEANLKKANLKEANLITANLKGADLKGAKLKGAILRGAILVKALLIRANLEGADLREAFLDKANLVRANLIKANLERALLVGANLTGVYLFQTIRYNWIIKDIKCVYIYFDKEGKKRIPEDRNFEKGEFEEYLNKEKQISEQITEMIKQGRSMNHVFISYVTEDKYLAIRLKEDLEKNGIKVWMDKYNLQPGVNWKIAIKNAINNGAYFIACFSDQYYKKTKSYMNEELNIAIENLRIMQDDQIWFIPVLLSDCKVPTFQIRPGLDFDSIQWVALYKDWNDGINRIVKVIKSS